MTTPIQIRPATDRDRAFLSSLGSRVLGSSLSSLRSGPIALAEQSYERLLDIVFSQSHVALIAWAGSDPVGFVLLLDEMPDEVTLTPQGFIAYMAVEPRFSRRGIARLLLDAAQDEARARGLPYLSLMVTEENLAARTLYEEAGFQTERLLLVKRL